jgi:CPA1 family monovalent cation:H+ antiporter
MVVVGLVIGNHGRAKAMSDTTRRYVEMFWELLDEILNAVLFVSFSARIFVGAAVAVLVTLLARTLTVGLTVERLARAPVAESRVTASSNE